MKVLRSSFSPSRALNENLLGIRRQGAKVVAIGGEDDPVRLREGDDQCVDRAALSREKPERPGPTHERRRHLVTVTVAASPHRRPTSRATSDEVG